MYLNINFFNLLSAAQEREYYLSKTTATGGVNKVYNNYNDTCV